jgi:hypothetical protein
MPCACEWVGGGEHAPLARCTLLRCRCRAARVYTVASASHNTHRTQRGPKGSGGSGSRSRRVHIRTRMPYGGGGCGGVAVAAVTAAAAAAAATALCHYYTSSRGGAKTVAGGTSTVHSCGGSARTHMRRPCPAAAAPRFPAFPRAAAAASLRAIPWRVSGWVVVSTHPYSP